MYNGDRADILLKHAVIKASSIKFKLNLYKIYVISIVVNIMIYII